MALTSNQIKELTAIAHDLDDHIDMGFPYSLTFFFDKEVPLTGEQKKKLEEYLGYHFKTIWGKTWICGEANKIRDFIVRHAKDEQC